MTVMTRDSVSFTTISLPHWNDNIFLLFTFQHQSPIAITRRTTYKAYPDFILNGYDAPPTGAVMYIENNGHSGT